ncbi:MAG: SDR family oxidoreductase [Saprospiraceae bacterium]|nr:SDR family oxidoreductase [Saprospiraceae bacterium]
MPFQMQGIGELAAFYIHLLEEGLYKTIECMRILITGNLGYVGPGVVKELRAFIPNVSVEGFDIGYFARNITNALVSPDIYLDRQHYGDVRRFPQEILKGVDAVVSLAAISNDPIGNQFEAETLSINYEANVAIAKLAKRLGVNRFIFASSCSVYGSAEEQPRKENSSLNPLTAYARSKILSEEALRELADEDFQVTCLRFATACGMSDRLRLDLVLNDFVAGALASGIIDILSDGTPWRPLIHVNDMARAIRWAIEKPKGYGGDFLSVNTGSNNWNYQVHDLAYAVQAIMPDLEVRIDKNAAPDKRSYKVNFDLFKELAPDHQPLFDLNSAVHDIHKGLKSIGFTNSDFRESNFMRLNVIKDLVENGVLDANLSLQ